MKVKKFLVTFAATIVSIQSMGATSDFIGTWVNMNPSTGGVVRFVVDSAYHVRMFGACHPTPCDFGLVPMTTYGSSVTDTTHDGATAHYDFSFKKTGVTFTLVNHHRINIDHYNKFTDSSGRQNYWMTERFRKATALESETIFSSQSNEPLN